MVHQRDAGETRLVRGRSPSRSQAAGSSPQGNRDSCRTTSSRSGAPAGRGWPRRCPAVCAGSSGRRCAERTTRSQARPVRAADGAHPAQLGGQHAGRDRTVARAVAAAAHGRRGAEHDHDRRQSGRARQLEVAASGARRPAPGCRPPWSGRAAAGRRRSGRAARTRPRTRRGRAGRCRRPRAARRTTRSPPPGSAAAPRSTCPSPDGPTSTTSAGSGMAGSPLTGWSLAPTARRRA